MRIIAIILFSFVITTQLAINSANAAEAQVADVFDIDGNGTKDALSDGLLTLRYLFDFRGDTLINRAIGDGAMRTSASQIETYLAAHLSELDIDGNGEAKALSDGLLLLRYLFGFREDSLINQAVADDATRKTAAEIEAYILTVVTPTGKLNDTGITQCANGTEINLACPVSTHPNQDAQSGRDATNNDDSDGHAGFSFTKISSTGAELPASATEWSCVKDNVTGLIWEVKTTDGGLHDKNNTYTWYNPDPNTNGGNAGTENGSADTDSFVADVNKEAFCGASDWRLPTREELRSLVDYSAVSPAIDTLYYPNTVPSYYWSSLSFIRSYRAWIINFFAGSDSANHKSHKDGHIRLVHREQ